MWMTRIKQHGAAGIARRAHNMVTLRSLDRNEVLLLFFSDIAFSPAHYGEAGPFNSVSSIISILLGLVLDNPKSRPPFS